MTVDCSVSGGAVRQSLPGVLVSMFLTFNANLGVVFTLKALVVVIMGGVGNLLGALIAGLFGDLDQDCQPPSEARQARADGLIAAGAMVAGDPYAILFDRRNAALPILRDGREAGNDGYTLATVVFEITARAVDWTVSHGPDRAAVASGSYRLSAIGN